MLEAQRRLSWVRLPYSCSPPLSGNRKVVVRHAEACKGWGRDAHEELLSSGDHIYD